MTLVEALRVCLLDKFATAVVRSVEIELLPEDPEQDRASHHLRPSTRRSAPLALPLEIRQPFVG